MTYLKEELDEYSRSNISTKDRSIFEKMFERVYISEIDRVQNVRTF